MTTSNREAIAGTYSAPNENDTPDPPDTEGEPTEDEPTVPAEPPTTPAEGS